MDSVVSIGKESFVDRVKKLYKTKKTDFEAKGDTISVSPFENSPFTPSKAKVKKISKNAKILSFTMQNEAGSKIKKSLLFYHLFNKQIKKNDDANKIFKGLKKHSKKTTSNVLFIADHLEPKSLLVLKHLLSTYKTLSLKRIVRITYRRMRIFSGILLHHHHQHIHYNRLHYNHRH